MDIQNLKTNVIMQPIYSVLLYQPANVQRLLSEDYIDYIIEDQEKEYKKNKQFSILQSITCGDLNDKRYILDGQHRIEAFKRLQNLGYQLDQYIPLIVYKTDSYEELREYYVRINQNHPINPLELSEIWFNYGKELCTLLNNEYKVYIKNTSKSCNCPYINIAELITYIKERHVFERIQTYTTPNTIVNVLFEKIIEFNKYLNYNYVNIIAYQLSSDHKQRFVKCYEKNNDNPCFLGVWRRFEWIEIIIYLIVKRIRVNEINLDQFSNVRKKIPLILKNNVWKKRNGNSMEGKCYVCDEMLCYENMECGHIVPHVQKGEITLDNLEPICKMCNRDMGAMNLNDYKQLYKK